MVGQEHLVGPGAPLARPGRDRPGRLAILWGPAGTGKTTLARLLAATTAKHLVTLSATAAGVKDVREALADAERRLGEQGQGTMLFIDEVHRFSKSQQDVLLPAVEDGLVVLIGATTENPFFEVNPPLLSRASLWRLHPLSPEDLRTLIRRGLELEGADAKDDADRRRGGRVRGRRPGRADHGRGGGGAGPGRRRPSRAGPGRRLTIDDMARARDGRLFHQGADEHYDQISALIKSVRGSDPDAGLYWMARMIEGGEDPRFLARRMVILASEDIGLADPQALLVAEAAARAVEYVGPARGGAEPGRGGHLPGPGAQVERRRAWRWAGPRPTCAPGVTQEVPTHLRDAHYKGAAALGHGEGYVYPHDDPSGVVGQQYRPEALEGRVYYEPSPHGAEGKADTDRQQGGRVVEAGRSIVRGGRHGARSSARGFVRRHVGAAGLAGSRPAGAAPARTRGRAAPGGADAPGRHDPARRGPVRPGAQPRRGPRRSGPERPGPGGGGRLDAGLARVPPLPDAGAVRGRVRPERGRGGAGVVGAARRGPDGGATAGRAASCCR